MPLAGRLTSISCKYYLYRGHRARKETQVGLTLPRKSKEKLSWKLWSQWDPGQSLTQKIRVAEGSLPKWGPPYGRTAVMQSQAVLFEQSLNTAFFTWINSDYIYVNFIINFDQNKFIWYRPTWSTLKSVYKVASSTHLRLSVCKFCAHTPQCESSLTRPYKCNKINSLSLRHLPAITQLITDCRQDIIRWLWTFNQVNANILFFIGCRENFFQPTVRF